MSAHRRSDWAAFGTCSECGAATPRAGGGRRAPRKTCGEDCRRKAIARAITTHGGSGTPLYIVWCAMIQRCTNEASPDWPNYGGRSVTVCQRWSASFEAFRDDMGLPPTGGMIERNDNERGYEPGNCRWASATEQMRNRRSTRFVEHDGHRRSIVEWSEVTGISEKTLVGRFNRGWSPSRALTEPAWLGKNQTS